MENDWSKISTADLMLIHHTFESRLENDDGTVTITLDSVAWSKCYGIMYEIFHELQERDERRFEGGES